MWREDISKMDSESIRTFLKEYGGGAAADRHYYKYKPARDHLYLSLEMQLEDATRRLDGEL